MKNFPDRRLIVLGIALASPSAFATNYDGVGVTFIGVPAFAFFNLLVVIFLAFRPSKWRKAIATILAAPLGILGAALLPDAESSLRHPNGWMEVTLCYGLATLAAYLYFRLMRAQPA